MIRTVGVLPGWGIGSLQCSDSCLGDRNGTACNRVLFIPEGFSWNKWRKKTMELEKPGSPGKWPLNGDGGKCCCTRKNHNENQLQSLHFFKTTC